MYTGTRQYLAGTRGKGWLPPIYLSLWSHRAALSVCLSVCPALSCRLFDGRAVLPTDQPISHRQPARRTKSWILIQGKGIHGYKRRPKYSIHFYHVIHFNPQVGYEQTVKTLTMFGVK
jgi:hypothetical protein